MRTPLVLLAGSLLVGCTVGDTGSGGDDGVGGAVCGDGVREGSEACDDGNTAGGDGCSASCDAEGSFSPAVMASLDRQSVATELGKVETLNVTLTSVDGFDGDVALAASVNYDGTPGAWIITQNKNSVRVTPGSAQTIALQVAVPSDSAALAGTLNLNATSAVTPVSLTAGITVANQYTVVIPAGAGTNVPHAVTAPNTLRLRAGTKVIFHNLDTVAHRIHGDGGIPHEAAGGGLPGGKYEVTPSGSATWYCHSHNESNVKTYNVAITP